MTYSAKRDFGSACAFLVFIVALLSYGAYCLADGGAVVVVAGLACVHTALLWVWFWFGTAYEITSSHVIARLGPIRWRIRKDEIVEAVPTSSAWLMVGGSHARFALSADAIMIKYRKQNGGKWLGFIQPAVLISPQDKAGFLHVLADGSTSLEQTDDGSVRLRSETAT